MHKKGALGLLLLLVVVIIVSILWKDDKPDGASIPIENTTEVITKNDPASSEEARFKLGKEQEKPSLDLPKEATIPAKKTDIPPIGKVKGTFTLINTKGQSYQLTLSDQHIKLLQNEKPIIIINLFASWCSPCTGQIAYLNDLQKKYQKELFIAGILTHDTIDKPSIESFMAKQQINYFISYSEQNDNLATMLAKVLGLDENFPIPLTVMYANGEYFTHYEGTVPVEMIEYDIQQAQKQLNSR